MLDRMGCAFEVKSLSEETGAYEGYGSVFGNVDSYGDVIEPGAFVETLKSNRRPKMLREHDTRRICGRWEEIREDDRGLYMRGRLIREVQDGAEAYTLMKEGELDGLSIGFRVTEADWTETDEQWLRTIKGIDLFEDSLVAFPANEAARVDAVKAARLTERDLERKLTRDAGLSRSVARALMREGFDGLKHSKPGAGPRDRKAADLATIRNLFGEMRNA